MFFFFLANIYIYIVLFILGSNLTDVQIILCKNMKILDGCTNVIFNDTESKFWDFYRAYEEEYIAEEMQQPDGGLTVHPLPVKSIITVLQALRNTTYDSSSSSSFLCLLRKAQKSASNLTRLGSK